jgi:uncharacterized membrane protein
LNPFDIKSALLARHAQHVVLIHFPIALFLVGVLFDFVAQRTNKAEFVVAARYNLLVAAIASLPVMGTGILAWRWQLEGQHLKGILLLHLVMGSLSSVLIWLVWWLHFRAEREPQRNLSRYRLSIEIVASLIVALTAHLGGFLSGVNGPG